jgi:hypothetical protein
MSRTTTMAMSSSTTIRFSQLDVSIAQLSVKIFPTAPNSPRRRCATVIPRCVREPGGLR